jgi:hypothetical protein
VVAEQGPEALPSQEQWREELDRHGQAEAERAAAERYGAAGSPGVMKEERRPGGGRELGSDR